MTGCRDSSDPPDQNRGQTRLMSQHLVLLGDSIFDNARYVTGGRPTASTRRETGAQGWLATLLAIDGNVISYVYQQLNVLPADASHLVLSIGGNDVLNQITILRERVSTVGEVFACSSKAGRTFPGGLSPTHGSDPGSRSADDHLHDLQSLFGRR